MFLNIIVNARWAIRQKGKGEGVITVKTFCLPDDPFVRVHIQDSGIGIAKDNLDKIFEAFFTTKDVVEGTGLGLSISYNVVKQHRGDIEVESRDGEGALFRLKFPIMADV